MTVIAEKTSPSGYIEYTLERLDDKSIVLTVAMHGGRMERTSYYPHVWEWVAESLGYVQSAAVEVREMMKPPRYSVGDLHGTPVVWEMNELIDGTPDPRPLSLDRIAEMLNERNR